MATDTAASVCVVETGERSFQPFQCRICQSRFTRHENLKRHATLHTRSRDEVSYSCDLCSTTFSRRDLLHRHMKRKHSEQPEAAADKRTRRNHTTAKEWSGRRRSKGAEASSASSADSQGVFPPQPWGSDAHIIPMDSGAPWPMEVPSEPGYHYSQYHSPASSESSTHATGAPATPTDSIANDQDTASRQHSATDGTRTAVCAPNPEDLDLDISLDTSILDFAHLGAAGPPLTEATGFDCIQSIPEGLSPRDLAFLQIDWCPSASQVARGLDLYFAHVSHFVPFLHRPTFHAARASRWLILSILCLAYQHGEDPDREDEAGSGESLSLRCFHQARVLLASEEDADENEPARNIEIVQAYLLLEICAVMYLCGSDSAHGLKMHHKMISVARFSGLTQTAMPGAAAAKDLDSLWAEFVKAESYKRTILAAHQIDALWYQLLSMPRSLSHLEIKHELPCPIDCWTAASAAEWALRQLTMRTSCPTTSMQYADAVRLFLSSDSELESLPAFDPYGAINITHFLLSSAREVSGWSAITGRISLDRLEPLRSSLLALGPFIRPQPGGETAETPSVALQEATWEIAMIELQIWSQSHTCGRIEGSVDAVLKEATAMAASGEISFGAETAQAAQPHITWFLRYLETAHDSESDPPWISLYAYKAFLIAWQLVRERIPCAMEVVGVQDGDVRGAVAWARRVFQRRSRRRVARLIVECLNLLAV